MNQCKNDMNKRQRKKFDSRSVYCPCRHMGSNCDRNTCICKITLFDINDDKCVSCRSYGVDRKQLHSIYVHIKYLRRYFKGVCNQYRKKL